MDRAAPPAAVFANAQARRRAHGHAAGGHHARGSGARADHADARAGREKQGRSRTPARPRRQDDSQQAAKLRAGRVNVRTKLLGAFTIYIALLAALSLYHVRTIRRAVTSGQDVTEIAKRLRLTSTVQPGRLKDVSTDA